MRYRVVLFDLSRVLAGLGTVELIASRIDALRT